MAEAINEYMSAQKRLYEAKEKIRRITLIISTLHQGLIPPCPLMILDCQIQYSLYDVSNIEQINISAKDWLSAKEIAEALKEIHEARRNYNNTYNNLNEIEKKSVVYCVDS